MILKRFRISLRTWLALVAMSSVFASILTREAKRQRGYIEPGDLLLVEVLDALPGHPITGERLVHRNGNIDLGYYGSLHAADLTMKEFKATLVNHLRTFLSDEALGLVRFADGSEGSAAIETRVDPADSPCVFVDTIFCDYLVEGEFSKSLLSRVNMMCGFEESPPPPVYGSYCGMRLPPESPEEKAARLLDERIQMVLCWATRPVWGLIVACVCRKSISRFSAKCTNFLVVRHAVFLSGRRGPRFAWARLRVSQPGKATSGSD